MSVSPSLRAQSDALHARVRAVVAGVSDETFDGLAADIARFQGKHVPAVGRLFRAHNLDLDAAFDAAAIPAVPSDAFRFARIAAHDAADDTAVFRTSGTTQGARGEHPMRTTATYEAAALRWGRALLFPDTQRFRVIVLAPTLAAVPDSSLGFMLDAFAREVGAQASWHVALVGQEASIDHTGVLHAAEEAHSQGFAALVLGTSFAFVHLLDALAGRRVPLPKGSRLMQTGGYKGRSREVPRDELRRDLAVTFDLPATHVVAEYGMTELSSQLYEATIAQPEAQPGLYVAPPWLRITAVNPLDLTPLPAGEVGLARFVDLANVDSAVAVQTADRVRVTPAGVELLGRAPGAPTRGCSLALEEMIGAQTI